MAGSTSLPVDDLQLIRPALVYAVAVARTGQAADPPQAPPESLRRVLRFHRLQTAALETVRRTLESDEGFRQKVSEASTEEELGRLAWLWLTRPDGWEEEVAALATEARKGDASEDDRDLGQLRRSLRGAEEAVRRHEAAASRAAEAARRSQTELTEARAARREAEKAAAASASATERATGERDTAQREAAVLAEEVARLRDELAVARSALHEAESELVLERALQADDGERADAARRPDRSDSSQLSEQLRTAAETAAALARTLDEAAGLSGDRPSPRASNPPSHRKQRRRRPERAGSARRGGPPRRPGALPPGVWDDSPAAAAHLVRLPGAVVLVDGYNVARTAWPGLTPEEERLRLVAALEELHARAGADIMVVFDGLQEGAPLPGAGSRTVRVRFTAEGTSADDVVRDLVDHFPVDRPVIVVSSDREVADGARDRGANAVSSRQFLTAFGR